MRTETLDYGRRGIERAGGDTTGLRPLASNMANVLQVRIAQEAETHGTVGRIDIPTNDGRPVSREAYFFNATGEAFRFLWAIAPFAPSCYVQGADGKMHQGMASPGFNVAGTERKPTLRIQPVASELVVRKGLWTPDPNVAIMTAGGVLLEGQGIGGHHEFAADPEHKLAAIGATSLNDKSIASGHKQHDAREGSSVVHAMTDGSIGNVYSGKQTPGFEGGFLRPFELTGRENRIIAITRDSIENPLQSFGAFMGHEGLSPVDYVVGAGLHTVMDRGAEVTQRLGAFTREMEGAGCSNS